MCLRSGSLGSRLRDEICRQKSPGIHIYKGCRTNDGWRRKLSCDAGSRKMLANPAGSLELPVLENGPRPPVLCTSERGVLAAPNVQP